MSLCKSELWMLVGGFWKKPTQSSVDILHSTHVNAGNNTLFHGLSGVHRGNWKVSASPVRNWKNNSFQYIFSNRAIGTVFITISAVLSWPWAAADCLWRRYDVFVRNETTQSFTVFLKLFFLFIAHLNPVNPLNLANKQTNKQTNKQIKFLPWK